MVDELIQRFNHLQTYLSTEKNVLLNEKQKLKEYMQAKLNSGSDWHSISDAANDLRDIEAKLEVIREVLDFLNG